MNSGNFFAELKRAMFTKLRGLRRCRVAAGSGRETVFSFFEIPNWAGKLSHCWFCRQELQKLIAQQRKWAGKFEGRVLLALAFGLVEECLMNRAKISPVLSGREALSPFKTTKWLKLTPAERLRRAWALRKRLRDPRSVHDRKLFPKP